MCFLFLLLLLFLSFSFVFTVVFELRGDKEYCLYEPINAASTSNRLVIRTSIVEPDRHDFIDVKVLMASGRTLVEQRGIQGMYSANTTKDNGLYSVCMTKRSYKPQLSVMYDLELIDHGSRLLTGFPKKSLTVTPTTTTATDHMTLRTDENEESVSVGLIEFDLSDVSHSTVNENVRIIASFTMENPPVEEVDIALILLPDEYLKDDTKWTWDNINKYDPKENHQYMLEHATHTVDETISVDVTEVVDDALDEKKDGILFMIIIDGQKDMEIRLVGIQETHTTRWPLLVFEDDGIGYMEELAYFKEYILELKSELAFISLRENKSIEVSKSNNQKVGWMALVSSVLSISIAIAQVFYVQRMLRVRY